MMPEFGLGFWQCKLRYYNLEQVLEVAREYYRRQIPVDVFVIDVNIPWPRDQHTFPDPPLNSPYLTAYCTAPPPDNLTKM